MPPNEILCPSPIKSRLSNIFKGGAVTSVQTKNQLGVVSCKGIGLTLPSEARLSLGLTEQVIHEFSIIPELIKCYYS
jgi:hypothetical protein